MLPLLYSFVLLATSSAVAAIVHPGLLHSADDFGRVIDKVNAQAEPWISGWNKLTANNHAQSNYTLHGPVETVYRGSSLPENYDTLFNDAAAAYNLALRWKISGDTQFADKVVEILDAWSGTLTSINVGSPDRFLASGLYGYQLANAGEILRDYEGWSGLGALQDMLLNVFYPMNEAFVNDHNGEEWDVFRANWDLCNMASALAIGVLADDQDKVDWALSRWTEADGTGQVNHFIWQTYEEEGSGKKIGQVEESGRDQGHATLDFSLVGAYAQMAFNQGTDLFAYNESQLLAASEYTAKYNVGQDVPYTPYIVPAQDEEVISADSRGTVRPAWELLYAHYNNIKGLNASWTGQMRDYVLDQSGGAEGGGGDYGSSSGGFDQLGFGTLMYRLE